MRAPSLVRTSSLYFHKARALHHKIALLRCNARSLRHQHERAQFTIHFTKEIKRTCSSSTVELYKLSLFRSAGSPAKLSPNCLKSLRWRRDARGNLNKLIKMTTAQ